MALLALRRSILFFTLLLFSTAAAAQALVLNSANFCADKSGTSYDLDRLIVSKPSRIAYMRWKQDGAYVQNCPAGYNCSIVLPAAPSTTTYTLEYALTSGGATSTVSAAIVMWLPPVIQLPAAATVCKNEVVTLNASSYVTNYTGLEWRNLVSGTTYTNGSAVAVTTSTNFELTATNPSCAERKATWQVNAQAPITVTRPRAMPTFTRCKGETLSLGASFVSYEAVDENGRSYPVEKLTESVTWAAGGQPVPDRYTIPGNVTISGTVNATVRFDACNGPQTHTVSNRTITLRITAAVSSLAALARYDSCPGDSALVSVSLTNRNNCDTIVQATATYPLNGCRLFSNPSPTNAMYRCAPIPENESYQLTVETKTINQAVTASLPRINPPTVTPIRATCLGDTSTVRITTECDTIKNVAWSWTTGLPAPKEEPTSDPAKLRYYRLPEAAGATFAATVTYRRGASTKDSTFVIDNFTRPLPSSTPTIPGYPITCRGTKVQIPIDAGCDTIAGVVFPALAVQPVRTDSSTSRWVYEKILDTDENITAEVTYYPRLANHQPKTITINNSLKVYQVDPWIEPRLLTDGMEHLCAGDSLPVLVHTHRCDTLIEVIWKNKQNNAVLTGADKPRPDANNPWMFYLKPNASTTYAAEIHYKRAGDGANINYRSYGEDLYVSVRERPRLLTEPAIGICQTGDKTINLDDCIFTEAVDTWNWIGVSMPGAYAPNRTNLSETVSVDGVYKYACSEMTTIIPPTAELTIVIQPPAMPSIRQPEGTTCCINEVPLEAWDSPLAEFTWTLSDGATIAARSYTYTKATAPGTLSIHLTMKNDCGVVTSPYLVVELMALPALQLQSGKDLKTCPGQSLELSATTPAGSVTWRDLVTGNAVTGNHVTVMPEQSTTYAVSAENSPCPASSDRVQVTFLPGASVTTQAYIEACAGTQVALQQQALIAAEGDLYWQRYEGGSNYFNVAVPTVTVDASATYAAIAHNDGCRRRDTAYTYIEKIDYPSVTTLADTLVCYGDTLDLNNTILTSTLSQGGTFGWTLYQSSVGARVPITQPDTYTVTAFHHLCGPAAVSSVAVHVRTPIDLYPVTLPPFYDKKYYDITFRLNDAQQPVYYSIAEGSLPPGLYAASSGAIYGFPDIREYTHRAYPITVEAIDRNNCKVQREYVLQPAWSAPNAFIPDGSDDRNKTFLGTEYYVEIYDRQGQLVHKGYGWNGYDDNGRKSPAGTYFYKAVIRKNNSVPTDYYSGYITILPPK